MNFTFLFLTASIALAMGDSAMYGRVQKKHGYMTRPSVILGSKMFITAILYNSIDPNMGSVHKTCFPFALLTESVEESEEGIL